MPKEDVSPVPAPAAAPLTISEMGRLGGLKRSDNMTAEERKAAASKAARARWKGHIMQRRRKVTPKA